MRNILNIACGRKGIMDENLLIVKFNGGLGNQMFQWAFARGLEKKTGLKVVFDMSYFCKKYARLFELGVFKINVNPVKNFWTKFKIGFAWKFRRLLAGKQFAGLNLYCEPHFEYDEKVFEVRPNTYIEGFFQSEKYFKHVEKELREDFEFIPTPDNQNQAIIERIKSTEAVSLHIRRGDYIQKKRYQDVYSTCSLDYYKRAVEYITKTVENPTLFIFSDDKNWVKENLKLSYESVYVDNNSGIKSFEDMRLMSLCKHNVIANSSFSWWGAWLNNNKEKIVIAPKKWFNDESVVQTDIIPENWIRLEN